MFLILLAVGAASSQEAVKVFSKSSSVQTQAAFRGVKGNERLKVEVLSRKLDSVPEWVRGLSVSVGFSDGTTWDYGSLEDTLVHTQVVITDDSGRIVDTFGWDVGDGEHPLDDRPGKILGMKEEKSRIEKGDYNKEPLFSATMEASDLFEAKQKWMDKYRNNNQLYTVLNNGLTDLIHASKFVGEDDRIQMCHEFISNNCWIGAEDFTKIAIEKPSTSVIKAFSFPGAGKMMQDRDQSAQTQPVQTPRSDSLTLANPQPMSQFQIGSEIAASQTCTIDNTAMKAQVSSLLENVYQQASDLTASEGVGAEYQAAAAPVLERGRAAIAAIPDQQTVTVPAGSAQGGGYSSETMDAVGKAFAEQGPCSAGLLLQSLQNQNKK